MTTALLVHGNFCLRSMLKDARSDQLLAMVGPRADAVGAERVRTVSPDG
ncbi:Uncharacterised protein [Salmonella enterica subsp. arizonae]|uniref:Uncharacterized protein n=1 Tax=Salmonella enterica subsp. arizonae TaxID=59203 RepID=A0A3S5DGA4_SALER|nr:Uncharacterised protein [Salmonella enterica subsp. arizonae]